MIYLDSAATTLIKPVSVEQSMIHALRRMSSPGRGGYESAMLAAEMVYRCREEAAALFGVSGAEQVVFTYNATHALNIAIHALVRQGMRVLVSGFEHNSVTRPLKAAGAKISIAGRKLFDAETLAAEFERLIPQSELVVCTHVSNVFGFVLPIYRISELCRKYSVPLIVDASQSAGAINIDFSKLGAAYVAMPGHKGLFGPQGTGILLCDRTDEPLLYGGSGSESIIQTMPDYLPDRYEAGTHNVCGIAGLCAGIEFVRSVGTENILSHEKKLLTLAVSELKDTDGIELFHGQDQCGVLSMRFENMSCDELAQGLYERGICVRSGLHCAPYAHESAGTVGTGTVRMSFSPFVTEEQVKAACEAIKEIYSK